MEKKITFQTLFPADIEEAILKLLAERGLKLETPIDKFVIRHIYDQERGYPINVSSLLPKVEEWNIHDLLIKVKWSLVGISMFVDNVDEKLVEVIANRALSKVSPYNRLQLREDLLNVPPSAASAREFAKILIDEFTEASSQGELKSKRDFVVEDLYEMKTREIFSASTSHCLWHGDIHTIEELLEFMSNGTCDLMKLHRFGKRSMNEVRGFLLLHKLRK